MAGWARERRRLLDRPRLPTCLPHAGEGHARRYRPWAWPCASLSSKPRAQESETVVFLTEKRRASLFVSGVIRWRASAIMADDGGGSRLDRLLRLLETGSTPAARHEAARQIGELASAHPNQLPNLLRRVRTQIRNRAGARPPRRVRFALRRRSRGPTAIRAGRPRIRARARGHDDETPSARVRIQSARHVCGTCGEETDRAIPRNPFLRTKDPRVPEAQAVGNPRRVRADHRTHLRRREARHRG